jgi:hypothetical protein
MLDEKLNGGAGKDYYDRRPRECAEEAARQQKQQAKQQVQQQRQGLAAQRSEDWQAWFLASLRHTGVMKTIGEFVAERCARVREHFAPKVAALEAKNAALEDRVKQLESQLSMDARFAQLEHDLAARQAALNEAKRGEKGERGARGARGEPRRQGRQRRAGGRAVDQKRKSRSRL